MCAFWPCLVCCLVVATWCDAYKILVIFPTPTGSHRNLGDGVIRHLLNDGHEVTYISAFPAREPAAPGVRVLDVGDAVRTVVADGFDIDAMMKKQIDFQDPYTLLNLTSALMRATLENEKVQNLLSDRQEHFDAVIAEWIFSELPIGFATIFECPFIWFSTMDVHWSILRLVDQPLNPAYSPDIMSPSLPPFTMWQRVTELYTQLKMEYLRYTYFDKLEMQNYNKLVASIVAGRGRKPPSFHDIKYNASLVLGNSHPSLGIAVRTPQNYVPVAGYHIEEHVKPLPGDLKQILDSAKNGVIYFSLGSTVKSKDIPKRIIDSITAVFSELRQTVLWKFEEELSTKPDNVHIMKWAPQQSILSHPNTILFITHGGLLSTTETIHFGIPVIGIPVFADQFVNVARAVSRGFALKVDLSYTMADEMKLAIHEMLANPRYAEKAKELSTVYHDRPVSPGRRLVHAVRHVIRTGGAPHLRSAALHVPLYQKLYLDLILVIALLLFVVVRVLKLIYRTYSLTKTLLAVRKTLKCLYLSKKTQ